jgi:hypothetical protein
MKQWRFYTRYAVFDIEKVDIEIIRFVFRVLLSPVLFIDISDDLNSNKFREQLRNFCQQTFMFHHEF